MTYGTGLTAEKVAKNSQVRRDHQDAFALANHRKAPAAINVSEFLEKIYMARTRALDSKSGAGRWRRSGDLRVCTAIRK